jgi:hypothetical protein
LPGIFIKLRPRWYYHLGQNSLLEDDQIFLHYQELYVEAKGGSLNISKAFDLAIKADSCVFELHHLVNQYNSKAFPSKPFPPPLLTEALLEWYYSHREKCASCRIALANIQLLKFWCAMIVLSALVSSLTLAFLIHPTSFLTVIIETVRPLALGLLSWRIHKLEN